MDKISTATRPSRVLLITAMVDHGTRSIGNAYRQVLDPFKVVEIPSSLASLGWRGLLALRKELIEAAREANSVVCLHHGAIIATALLLPRRTGVQRQAVLDWSRAFPSQRQDRYIRVYNPIFKHLLKRFDSVWSPARKFCEFYNRIHRIQIEETLYPLPYPDHLTEEFWTSPSPRLLFIGADFQRKGGDLVLALWPGRRSHDARLTFVCPNPPTTELPGVEFLTQVQAKTPQHLQILREHDVFVLPSRREAFGYAALEALNFGQVVVTSRQAGIAPLVEEAGGLVGETPEDAVRLAIDLIGRPDEVRERRARIRRYMADYPARFAACLKELRGA